MRDIICTDCVKSRFEHGIIQFCYTHAHAKEMREILEEFSQIMDKEGSMSHGLWFDLVDLQEKADRILQA